VDEADRIPFLAAKAGTKYAALHKKIRKQLKTAFAQVAKTIPPTPEFPSDADRTVNKVLSLRDTHRDDSMQLPTVRDVIRITCKGETTIKFDLQYCFIHVPIYPVHSPHELLTYRVCWQAYKAAIKDFVSDALQGIHSTLDMKLAVTAFHLGANALAKFKSPPPNKYRTGNSFPTPTSTTGATTGTSTLPTSRSASSTSSSASTKSSLVPIPPGTCKGTSWFEHPLDPSLRLCYYCLHFRLSTGTYAVGEAVPQDCWHVKTGQGKYAYSCPIKDSKDADTYRYYHKKG
jgi:hypothetical protein